MQTQAAMAKGACIGLASRCDEPLAPLASSTNTATTTTGSLSQAWLASGCVKPPAPPPRPAGPSVTDMAALDKDTEASTQETSKKSVHVEHELLEAHGIWQPGADISQALRPFFDDDLSVSLWHAALRGDGRTVYALIHLHRASPFLFVRTDDLPPRMFHWGLLEFVRFAVFFWKDDVVRAGDLQQVCQILEEVEAMDREFVRQYYENFREDSDHLLWLSWSKGLLKLEETSQHGETRLDNFWAAFGSDDAAATRASFTGPEDWWTFDPFMSARNCRFECPKYCRAWKLRDWTHFRAGATAAVRALEESLLMDAAAGWECWTMDEEIFISLLLCENVEVCRKWLRNGENLSCTSDEAD